MIALCREQRLEHRTKHIALHYFLAWDLQQCGQLRLAYVSSAADALANTADVFTKALGSGDHQCFCTALGLPASRTLLPCPPRAALPCSPCPAALQPMHRAALPLDPHAALPCNSRAALPCSAAQRVALCCPAQRVAPYCPARRALLPCASRPAAARASRPTAARASRSAALRIAPCFPAHRAVPPSPSRPAPTTAPPAPPSRHAATTAATAARATAAAGGDAARSAGSAAGAGGAGGATGSAGGAAGAGGVDSGGHCLSRRTPPLSRFASGFFSEPIQVVEALVFLRTAQRRQQIQQETFSLQVLSESVPQRCVTGSVEATALGASDSAAALGASESTAALGASESSAALGASESAAAPDASESLPSVPRLPAPPCLPCVEGRQRYAPHSFEFSPTTAPLQTLHMDVWSPTPVGGTDQERFFMLVVDDYTRYTTVFPLRRKAEVSGTGALRSLLTSLRSSVETRASTSRSRFRPLLTKWDYKASHWLDHGETSPTLRWRGKVGNASVLRVLGALSLVCDAKASKLSSRTLRCDVTFDESVCFYGLHPHASHPVPLAPHFLVPVPHSVDPLPPQGYAPSGVSRVDPLPILEPLEISFDSSGPAEGGDPAADDTAATRRSPRLETPPGFPPRPSSPPPQHAVEDSRAETSGVEPGGAETEGVGFGGAANGGAGSGGAATGGAGSWGAAPGGASSWGAATGGAGAGGTGGTAGGVGGAARAGGTSGAAGAGGAGATSPRGATVAAGSGGAGGTAGDGGARAGGTGGAGAAGPGGACTRAAGPGGACTRGGAAGARGATEAVGTGGAGGTAGAGGARAGGTGGSGGAGAAGAGGACASSAGGAGAAGSAPRRLFFYPQPWSSLPPHYSVLRQVHSLPSSTGLTPPLLCSLTDQSPPQLLPCSSLPAPAPHIEVTESLTEHREPETRASTPVRAPRPRPPTVPGTHGMALRPSSVPQHVVLPKPPTSCRPHLPGPESNLARAASPTVTRLLATVVTDPDLESTASFALVIELVDFAARSRLDYVASLVSESDSVCPPSDRGEPALSSDVLGDREFELECLAAALPRFASMLLCSEGDPDALDIPTPRSYAEAIAGEYSSHWQTAMDAEMASWKSTGTYVDEVPPLGANKVDGMWIFIVKRPPDFPPAFKARYVARGFSQRQGVDFFHTFSPTLKMTTLGVLLHVAAQRDYELHSLDFSEEIWLRRPPVFTVSFPAGTQWSLRRPVYDLRQAPREWHDTLRTTLAALGFAPSSADPSLFLRTDTTLPPFYVIEYADDLVFATAGTEALALVKAKLQERHTCYDLVHRARGSCLEDKVQWYSQDTPTLLGSTTKRLIVRHRVTPSDLALVLSRGGPVVLLLCLVPAVRPRSTLGPWLHRSYAG
ncbi:unnamed protein product [Closterium sp. NIES-53]